MYGVMLFLTTAQTQVCKCNAQLLFIRYKTCIFHQPNMMIYDVNNSYNITRE